MRRVLFISIGVLSPLLATAHGLLLDAASDGRTISGTAYYSNGERAANEAVSLRDLDAGQAEPATAQTDARGDFSFPALPSHRYQITVHGEEGHSVELELLARSKAKPELIHRETAGESRPWPPPAWLLIGGALLFSLVPALLRRRRDHATG